MCLFRTCCFHPWIRLVIPTVTFTCYWFLVVGAFRGVSLRMEKPFFFSPKVRFLRWALGNRNATIVTEVLPWTQDSVDLLVKARGDFETGAPRFGCFVYVRTSEAAFCRIDSQIRIRVVSSSDISDLDFQIGRCTASRLDCLVRCCWTGKCWDNGCNVDCKAGWRWGGSTIFGWSSKVFVTPHDNMLNTKIGPTKKTTHKLDQPKTDF